MSENKFKVTSFIRIGYGLSFKNNFGVTLADADIKDRKKAWDVLCHPFAKRNDCFTVGDIYVNG